MSIPIQSSFMELVLTRPLKSIYLFANAISYNSLHWHPIPIFHELYKVDNVNITSDSKTFPLTKSSAIILFIVSPTHLLLEHSDVVVEGSQNVMQSEVSDLQVMSE